MKTLFKNGSIVNVFTDEIEQTNVLIDDGRIIGVDPAYTDDDADKVIDVTGKTLCPGFIDGHIHIESTMLMPSELAKACVPHGTTAIVADPHEIANVCGIPGIRFMLEASRDLPMMVYVVIPSCVPATRFDESGAELTAADIRPLYKEPRILGLGEMMNYPGVIGDDPATMQKLIDAAEDGVVINGHAPLLGGKDLDKYIRAGVRDDHECSNPAEAAERIRKGQWLMIRQGTSARNLEGLLPMFDEPYNHRCLLVTDDKHPMDLLNNGHIDSIIRKAGELGKSVIVGIRMASLQAAQRFGLVNKGAIAPGYDADLLVLDDLQTVKVRDVYYCGRCVAENGAILPFDEPKIPEELVSLTRNSFHLDALKPSDFHIEPKGKTCRVIRLIKDQLLTDEWITDIDFSKNNGIDFDRDILKLAVIERHHHTGHIGLGFISGVGMKSGAIASSVSHDSHNLIVIGTGEEEMAVAANRIREMEGGMVVVENGKVIAELPLMVAGLMSDVDAFATAEKNEAVRKAVHGLGAPDYLEPFMSMAFVSLSVIPSLKMITRGLIDVIRQQPVDLFVE